MQTSELSLFTHLQNEYSALKWTKSVFFKISSLPILVEDCVNFSEFWLSVKELILQEEKYLNILYNWIGNHRNSLHLHRTLPLRILFLFENRVLEQALTPF